MCTQHAKKKIGQYWFNGNKMTLNTNNLCQCHCAAVFTEESEKKCKDLERV